MYISLSQLRRQLFQGCKYIKINKWLITSCDRYWRTLAVEILIWIEIAGETKKYINIAVAQSAAGCQTCNNSTCRAIKRNKRLLPPPLITWEAVDGEIQCDCGAAP